MTNNHDRTFRYTATAVQVEEEIWVDEDENIKQLKFLGHIFQTTHKVWRWQSIAPNDDGGNCEGEAPDHGLAVQALLKSIYGDDDET